MGSITGWLLWKMWFAALADEGGLRLKRALIGGWLALLGTIWGAGVIIAASQMLVDSWDPVIGRFLATILDRQLIIPFVIAALFLLLGLVSMAVEFFKE